MATAGLNTSGFQVNVMPQVSPIDPRLFASDPTRFASGIMDTTQLLNAFAVLQQQKDQMAEQAATRDARVASTRALSDLNVLNRDAAAATQAPRIEGDLANLALGIAKDRGALANLASDQELANLQRTFNTKKLSSDLKDFDENLKLSKDAAKAAIRLQKAQGDAYFAEAEKDRAAAIAGGGVVDKATEAFHRQVGEISAMVGKSPTDVQLLYQSGALNSKGLPLASELAQYSENVKKHEFFVDPAAALSPELKAWMGDSGLAALTRNQMLSFEGEQAEAAESAGATTAPNAFTIDADGNITNGQAAPAEEKPQSSTGESVKNAAATAGLLSLASLASPTVRGKVGDIAQGVSKAASRAWNGRSKTGTFTGKALKTLPQRSLKQFAKRGLGAAAGPVGALYTANDALGSLMSDEATGDLTAIEAMALGATAPSFERQAQEAKYDELSSRIGSIMRSTSLDDATKNAELERLINQRDVIWSFLQRED